MPYFLQWREKSIDDFIFFLTHEWDLTWNTTDHLALQSKLLVQRRTSPTAVRLHCVLEHRLKLAKRILLQRHTGISQEGTYGDLFLKNKVGGGFKLGDKTLPFNYKQTKWIF